jgi:hypothetical protein
METLSNRRAAHRDYVSRFGKVDAHRTRYYTPGASSICPIDEELSLPARSYSYEVQKKWMGDVVRGPFADAKARTSEWIDLSVSQRTGEELIREVARDVDAFYADQAGDCPEETGEVLVAAIDCKGVPLLAKELKKQRTQGKGGRKPKKKMATVAAVYTQGSHVRTAKDILKEVGKNEVQEEKEDPAEETEGKQEEKEKPRPENKRVWASLTKSKDEVFEEVRAEMARRDPKRKKIWACLTDGEKALQRRALSILGKFAPVILILDLFHVLGYLWDAAHAFHEKDSEKARKWVHARLSMILQGKVSRVVAGMRQSATKQGLRGAKRKAVDRAANYFLGNKAYMRYDEYLAKGLPIGSGAAEGACRNLIQDRLERTGMRWSIATAEAVIQMRSVELSGHTADYWDYHIDKEHKRLYLPRRWRAFLPVVDQDAA